MSPAGRRAGRSGRRAGSSRRRGARTLAALVLVALAVTAALAATLAACGGDSAAGADDPLAGYWIGGEGTQMTLLQIEKDGDEYVVKSNPDQPMGELREEDGSLVAETSVVTVRITPEGQDQLVMEFSGELFKESQTTTLSRVDQTEYADGAVAYGLLAIQRGLEMWRADGHRTYPPPRDVAPDGRLAGLIAWPANLFTGGPMVQETGPGNFSYGVTRGGKDYTLEAYLSDGSTIGK